MDRTIIATLEQMRSFDYVQGNHDALLGIGNLAQDILSQMGLTATSQVVVAGLAATQTTGQTGPSLTINIGPGRVYVLAAADTTSAGAITVDPTIVCQQGSAAAQTVTLTPPSSGQSQWNLIQCQYQQGDAVRTNDPTGGVVPFYNSSNPTVPNPATINTVRQARCILQVLTGAAAATGSEVPPQPTNGWTPLYLVDLVGGQTQITNAQILVAGPSVGTGVPSNYPRAPFLAGLLASHHSGNAGQAPKVNLASEVQGVLPYANMSPVRTLLGSSLNLYVSPTGNDSNSGTDPSHPFLTIQAAVNSVYHNYDFNGNGCTINIANGTYNVSTGVAGAQTAAVLFGGVPLGLPGFINLIGNEASPGSVTINATGIPGIVAGSGAVVLVAGVTVTSSGTSQTLGGAAGYGIVAGTGAYVAIRNVVVGSCGVCQLRAQTSGTLTSGLNPFTLTGTVPVAISVDSTCLMWLVGSTITVSGLTCTSAFAGAVNCGVITFLSNTFIGSATGPRFSVSQNGVIGTSGGGANYLPGNSAGSTSTGGQYI